MTRAGALIVLAVLGMGCRRECDCSQVAARAMLDVLLLKPRVDTPPIHPAYCADNAPIQLPTSAMDPRLDDMRYVPADDPAADPFAPSPAPPPLDAFYIDRTEVTVLDYRECVDAGICATPDRSHGCTAEDSNWHAQGHAHHPINCIKFLDAWKYCRYRGKTLPTARQWEKAARGTDGRRYPWGDQQATCEDVAVMQMDGDPCPFRTTVNIGSKPMDVSPYGVLDMGGNVREWVRARSTDPDLGRPPQAHASGAASGGGVRSALSMASLASEFAIPGADVGVRCSLGP